MTRRGPAEADLLERRVGPLSIPVHGQGDLLEHSLLDEIAARILGDIPCPAVQLHGAGRRLEQPGRDPRRVVFPDPFGPSSATISPRRSSRPAPSRTGTAGGMRTRRHARRARARRRGLVFQTQAPRARRAGARRPAARARPPSASRRMRPPSTKRTRVASSSARATRCSERTTVAPSRSTAVRKSAAASGSSCEVGSSRRSSAGSSTSAEARQTRCNSRPRARRSSGSRGGERRQRRGRVRPAARSPAAERRGSRARRRPRLPRSPSRPGPPGPGRRSPPSRRARPVGCDRCRGRRPSPVPRSGRRGSAARGRRGREARSTCPPRTARQGHDLARRERERDVAQRRRRGRVRERAR